MEQITHLIETRPLVALHLGAALLALLIGAVVMLRRKGTASHKLLGWAWVALMLATAITSGFVREGRMPNIAGFSPIHLLTVWVLITLPIGIVRIRRGNVAGHRSVMRGMFFGACVIAGAFTLLPGRFLGDLLWRQTLQLVH